MAVGNVILAGIDEYFPGMVWEQDIGRVEIDNVRQFASAHTAFIIGLEGKRRSRSSHKRKDELPINKMPSFFGKLRLSWCLNARISPSYGQATVLKVFYHFCFLRQVKPENHEN